MTELKKCRACGVDVPSNAPSAHCPKCLLELGFASHPEDATEESISNRRFFGDYELLEQIGRGGMGIVYKARQLSLHRVVALKMILAGELASPSAVHRFQIEAEAAAKLEHPNIVPIHGMGMHRGEHYFTMKFVEGRSLAGEIRHGKFRANIPADLSNKAAARQRQQTIARLMATVARSVHYAHQHGVLHRDLKPSNILVDGEGQPHLTDFGLAKILEHDVGLTGSKDVMGSASYMSPEQAAGRRLTALTDIYSLGAILYELLTGRPPFCGATGIEVLQQLAKDEPSHPRTIHPGVDSDLATICLKCLEKDPPLRRYTSAEAMAEDLERWLRHEPIHARRSGPILRVNRWVRRNPAGAGLIGVLCITLAIMLGLLGWVYREQQSKHEALGVLQRGVVLKLAKLWTNSIDGYETIESDTLAALRGERSVVIPPAVRSLDLTFAVYVQQEPGKMLEMMVPVLGKLEKSVARSMSRPVRIDLRIYRRYGEALDALVGGKVHFMRVGSSSYIEAKERDPHLSLLAKQNGQIRGYIFAHLEAGIRSNSLADLNGKSIAFVEDSSTTGNYLPKFELRQARLTAGDLRDGSTNYRGSHDTVVKEVAAHKFEAGAANASIVDAFMAKPGSVKLIIVREFKEAMGLPWVASTNLNAEAIASIRAGLLAIRDQVMLKALGNGTTGFLEARDEDYNSLREAMEKAAKFDSPNVPQPLPSSNKPKP